MWRTVLSVHLRSLISQFHFNWGRLRTDQCVQLDTHSPAISSSANVLEWIFRFGWRKAIRYSYIFGYLSPVSMPLTVYSQRRVKHLYLLPLSRNDCISKRKGGFYIFHSILMEKLFLQWRLNSSNSVPESFLYRSCVSHQAAYNTLVSTNSTTLWLPITTQYKRHNRDKYTAGMGV